MILSNYKKVILGVLVFCVLVIGIYQFGVRYKISKPAQPEKTEEGSPPPKVLEAISRIKSLKSPITLPDAFDKLGLELPYDKLVGEIAGREYLGWAHYDIGFGPEYIVECDYRIPKGPGDLILLSLCIRKLISVSSTGEREYLTISQIWKAEKEE